MRGSMNIIKDLTLEKLRSLSNIFTCKIVHSISLQGSWDDLMRSYHASKVGHKKGTQ